MKLIYLSPLLGLLLTLFGCSENVKDLDYCSIHTTDQSFVNTDKSDMVKFEADKSERAILIKKNFKNLISYSEAYDFPFVEPNDAVLDSCKYWAVTMTMIHAAQVQPEDFFSRKNIKLFQRELKKGNIRTELMEQSVIIMVKTYDICEYLKPKIMEALKIWELDRSLMDDAKFKKC